MSRYPIAEQFSKDTAPVNAADASLHGLTAEEFTKIEEFLGRAPNLIETGIFAVMWSEHCSYKSTRLHLAKLPTKGARVIKGPGENAGVVDFGDGDAVVFKMESHNHPSFIEPYQGAATGVGGILRDVFTMGARPVANLNALRFGALEHKLTPHLLAGVTAGIGGYGNCVGVPTVAGECGFDKAYNGNILVNAMSVGLAKSDKLFYSAAASVGSPIVYFGAGTGRDGINGAVMASDEFSEGEESKRPTVQVGDPFTEKRVLEACLELMETGAVQAIQDMGAAGLTCSSLEMASKGETGVHLELDKVPLREKEMTPYELMLSESQERMLAVITPGQEATAAAIFQKWEIEGAVIGKIIKDRVMRLTVRGEQVAEMPVPPLADSAPVYDRPHEITRATRTVNAEDIINPPAHADALKTLIASPEGCSKRYISRQYDSQVMGDTVATGGDAAIIRVHGKRKGIAVTADCTPRYCAADPVEGGRQAVAESYRNLCAVGADPVAVTNCLNFGNPEKKHIMGQLVGCLQGMGEACAALDYPVVSGNVSLYNETDGAAILPTPSIGGVGLVADISTRAQAAFSREGDIIAVIGGTSGWLGCSVYAREIMQDEDAAPPPVNLISEKKHGGFIRKAITEGLLDSVHDISDGGIALALADMALNGVTGCDIAADSLPEGIHPTAFFFGEDQARYLIAFPEEKKGDIVAAANEAGIAFSVIGRTGGDAINLAGSAVPLSSLRAICEAVIPGLFATERRESA